MTGRLAQAALAAFASVALVAVLVAVATSSGNCCLSCSHTVRCDTEAASSSPPSGRVLLIRMQARELMGGAYAGSPGAAELEQRRADAALSQLLAARREQGAGYHQNGKELARARIAMRVLEHSLQGELSSVKEVLAQLHRKPAGITTLHEGDAAWQRRTMQRGALQVCKFTCSSVYMTCNTCNMYTSTYICVHIHNMDTCTGTNTYKYTYTCIYIYIYIYI